MTEPDWDLLERAWQPARKAGVLGQDPVRHLRDHAAGYLPAAWRVDDEFMGIDLGTGAGVPGLLLALLRPRSRWVLLDASQRRCEFASVAVEAMAVGDRVTVIHARAEDLARASGHRVSADLVVVRAFGAPAEVAECGLALLAPAGRLVVSVTAATASGWTGLPAAVPGARTEEWGTAAGRYLQVRMDVPVADSLPRRPAARRRAPLF